MSRKNEINIGEHTMRILTRQEAERLFSCMQVSSTRLEHDSGELRIRLVFENRDALIVKYSIRDHLKRYWLIRPEPCPEG